MNWNERSKKVIAQNCTTYSKRSDQFIEGSYPTHAEYADGCTIWASIGDTTEQYVDMTGSLGASLIEFENLTSLPHINEVILAERLVKLINCVEKLKFLRTGSESCQAAVRIARAYQKNKHGNDFCHGIGNGYHGWHNCFIASEKPGTGTIKEGYEKVESISAIIEELKVSPHWFGYVIIEPVQLKFGKKEILELKELRDLCTQHDIVLIYDEIIVGMRVPNYFVANEFKKGPDLICGGKSLGGKGYAISFVGGRKEIMDTEGYFISSTFSGELTGINSAIETLDFLTPAKLRRLWATGTWFQDEFNQIVKSINIKLNGIPTRAIFDGNEDQINKFWELSIKDGILYGKSWFITFSHTRAVLRYLLKSAKKAVKEIAGGYELKGQPRREIFKRV